MMVSWDSELKGDGFQESWSFLRKEVLEVQEQSVPLCCKMSWWKKTIMDEQETFSEVPGESLLAVEEGTGNLGQIQRSH